MARLILLLIALALLVSVAVFLVNADSSNCPDEYCAYLPAVYNTQPTRTAPPVPTVGPTRTPPPLP